MNIPVVCDTERRVEVPWIVAHLERPQRLLDVGAADCFYVDDLLATGAAVTLLDTRPIAAPRGATTVRGDVCQLPDDWRGRFDLVVCCSVLDHIGLDAYGNVAVIGALDQAVRELTRITQAGGRLLLTVPCGRDLVTTHPGGGQRILSLATLQRLFLEDDWRWRHLACWRLVDETYLPCQPTDVTHHGYAGHRADAVIAGELVRL